MTYMRFPIIMVMLGLDITLLIVRMPMIRNGTNLMIGL